MVLGYYTDEDGNEYELRPQEEPTRKGDRACLGCAFKFGNSKACQAAPTCTPANKPKELYGTSLRWYLVKHWLDKKDQETVKTLLTGSNS